MHYGDSLEARVLGVFLFLLLSPYPPPRQLDVFVSVLVENSGMEIIFLEALAVVSGNVGPDNTRLSYSTFQCPLPSFVDEKNLLSWQGLLTF